MEVRVMKDLYQIHKKTPLKDFVQKSKSTCHENNSVLN